MLPTSDLRFTQKSKDSLTPALYKSCSYPVATIQARLQKDSKVEKERQAKRKRDDDNRLVMMRMLPTIIRRIHFGVLVLVLLVLPQNISLASQAAGSYETLVGVVGRDFILLGADSSVQSASLAAVDKISVLSEPHPETSSHAKLIKPNWSQQTIAAAAAGNPADADRLLGILRAYCAMQEYGKGVGIDVEYPLDDDPFYCEPGLSVESLAHFCRGEIATSLRTREQWKVCLLIAGMMPGEEDSEEEETAVRHSRKLQDQVRTATAKWDEDDKKSKDEQDESTTSSTARSSMTLKPHLYWLDEYGSVQKLQYGAHGGGSHFILSILDTGFRPNMSRDQAQELVEDCFRQLRSRFVINDPRPPCIKIIDRDGCRRIDSNENSTVKTDSVQR